ncbi:hypothetical protein Ddc_17534 [Ditylenchus destructor]|nr:hypothetical protein Ddc_17534 [Ditylenchus destructor]
MYHRTITYYLSPYQYENNDPKKPIRDKFTTKRVFEMSLQNITKEWVFLLFDALHIICGYNKVTQEVYYDPRLLSERRRRYLPKDVQKFLNVDVDKGMLEDVKSFLKSIRRYVDRTMYIGVQDPNSRAIANYFPFDLNTNNTRNTFIIYAAHKIAEQAMGFLKTSQPALNEQDRSHRMRDLRAFLSRDVFEPSGYMSHVTYYGHANFLFTIHPTWQYVGNGPSIVYKALNAIGSVMVSGFDWAIYKSNDSLQVDKIEYEDDD